MNKNGGRAIVILGLFGCVMATTAARAEEAMMMPTAGPEVKALAQLFGTNATWTGKVEAGSMGPDSKETVSHGKAIGHAILGGMWYACDVEDVIGTGKDAIAWKGHMMVGYDLNSKSYKAATVDNMGALMVMDGKMDGTKFVLETPTEIMMMGVMMKSRLSWDMADPKAVAFTDERQVGGGDWKLAESGTMRPMAAAASKK